MPITTATLDASAIDRIPAESLLSVLGIDLAARSRWSGYGLDCDADAYHETEWADAAGQSWTMRAYGLVVGSRLVVWTCTDEAGVSDVDIIDDADPDDIEDYVRDLCEDVAAGL